MSACHRIVALSFSLPERPVRINLRHDSFRQSNRNRKSRTRTPENVSHPTVPASEPPGCGQLSGAPVFCLRPFVHANESSVFVFCSPLKNLLRFWQLRGCTKSAKRHKIAQILAVTTYISMSYIRIVSGSQKHPFLRKNIPGDPNHAEPRSGLPRGLETPYVSIVQPTQTFNFPQETPNLMKIGILRCRF